MAIVGAQEKEPAAIASKPTEATPTSSTPNTPTETKITALHIAALKQNVEEVKKIINDDKSQVTQVDSEGRDPLSYVIAGTNTKYEPSPTKDTQEAVDIVIALLDGGTKIDRPDNRGRTPLAEAIERGSEKIATELEKRGATLSEKEAAALYTRAQEVGGSIAALVKKATCPVCPVAKQEPTQPQEENIHILPLNLQALIPHNTQAVGPHALIPHK